MPDVHRAAEVEHEPNELGLQLRGALLGRLLGPPPIHGPLARDAVDEARFVELAVRLAVQPHALDGTRLTRLQEDAQLLHLLADRLVQPLVHCRLVLGHVDLLQALLVGFGRHLTRGLERLGRHVRLLLIADLVDWVAIAQAVRTTLAAQPGRVAAAAQRVEAKRGC